MPPYAVVPTLNPANMGSLQVEVPATSAPASMALPFQTYQHNGVTYFNQASPVQFVPVQPAPMQSVPCVPMQMHNGSPVPMTMEGPVATTASEPIAVPVMTASQTQPGHSPPSLSVSPVSMCSPAPSEHSGYQATPPYQHQHHHTPPAAVAPQVIYMAPAPTTMMVSPVPFSAAPSQMGGHAFGATPPPQQFSPMPTPGGSPRSLTPASQSHSGGEKGGERSLSTRLEVVWHGEFERLFKSYPHQWELTPISDPKTLREADVHKFMDSAKVRFMCPNCSNCWTSMKGRVYFMYILDPVECIGRVYFTLIGQKCSKCPDKDFVHAMWYPDEILKVISNVHQKVGQSYYGLTQPIVRLDRRKGQPKKPHMLQSCQACTLGICREEHNFR